MRDIRNYSLWRIVSSVFFVRRDKWNNRRWIILLTKQRISRVKNIILSDERNETKYVCNFFLNGAKNLKEKLHLNILQRKTATLSLLSYYDVFLGGINLKLARKKENLIKCNSPLRRKLLSADAARVRNLSVKDKSRAQDDLIWAIVVAHYKVLPSFFFSLLLLLFPSFSFSFLQIYLQWNLFVKEFLTSFTNII